MPSPITFVLDERKLKSLQKKLGPDMVLPPVGRLIRTMAEQTQEEATRNAPRDTGALAADIASDVQPLRARVHTALPYARPMEGGRKPFSAGGHMPPPDALARIAAPGTTFALARSIGQRGIRGRFFFRKARTKAYRILPTLIRQAAGEMARFWGQ